MKDYNNEEIKIGDSVINFNVDDAIRNDIEQVMVNPDSLWTKYVNADTGEVDFNLLKSDMLWLAQKDQISKVISDQFKNLGKEEVIKNDKNIDFSGKKTTIPKSTNSKAKLYNAFLAAHGGR